MQERFKGLETVVLIACILLCELVGLIGALATRPAIGTWYQSLEKPFFSPPNWIFGPAWTILYGLMGIAAFLVWRKGLHITEVRRALAWFCLQLALNGVWSWLFFGLRSPLLGLIDIVLLWFVILRTIHSFLKVSRSSGWLLLPYIAWVSFALLLNSFIWVLNR
jgi:translocator protein